MPAYRSAAEAEVRDAVVAELRQIRPEARIMHEVNCALFGPNRIDVIAVSAAEIISVEVKSSKDKLDRLPAQITSMRTMSHHVIAALHEKHLVEHVSNEWAAHYERDGRYWIRSAPPEAEKAIAWVFPRRRRAMKDTVSGGFDFLANWKRPDPAIMRAIPAAIDMLWAAEMREFCHMYGLAPGRRASREMMLPLIRWRCTGEQITKGVCRILRARAAPEADPPIVGEGDAS